MPHVGLRTSRHEIAEGVDRHPSAEHAHEQRVFPLRTRRTNVMPRPDASADQYIPAHVDMNARRRRGWRLSQMLEEIRLLRTRDGRLPAIDGDSRRCGHQLTVPKVLDRCPRKPTTSPGQTANVERSDHEVKNDPFAFASQGAPCAITSQYTRDAAGNDSVSDARSAIGTPPIQRVNHLLSIQRIVRR
jgi:hypothetical protein